MIDAAALNSRQRFLMFLNRLKKHLNLFDYCWESIKKHQMRESFYQGESYLIDVNKKIKSETKWTSTEKVCFSFVETMKMSSVNPAI